MIGSDRPAFECAGLVLAGGRGRRFGGLDKGLQRYQGKRLVEHALAHLAGCDPLIVSANRHPEVYRALGVEVIGDRRADYQGPLSGIESVLSTLRCDWVYVVPCDVLGMPEDWLAHLREQAMLTGSPWVGTLDGTRLQPLLGLWSKTLLSSLSAFLDTGQRRVMDFVAPWAGHALRLPDACQLRNLNRPELLRQA